MTHTEFADQILTELAKPPATPATVIIDDSRRKNAGRCMGRLACHRLAQNADVPEPLRHNFFEWHGGLIALRNSPIADSFWTNLLPSIEEAVYSRSGTRPAAFLFIHWALDDGLLHAWAIPADVARACFAALKADAMTGRKTVLISLDDHSLHDAPNVPSLAPYYIGAALTEDEQAKLLEAIKTDDNVKQERFLATEGEVQDDYTAGVPDDVNDETEVGESPLYTFETVEFLQELPNHVNDGSWHEQNKRRYERVLRDPSQAMVEQLSARYIQRLNPAVGGGKRHLSILKKNDFGKGGYHDHYWFAFYDPAAGSKIKSAQLFVGFLGSRRIWQYGLAFGVSRGPYLERLLKSIAEKHRTVADYLRGAPIDTKVRLIVNETEHEMPPADFAQRLEHDVDGEFGLNGSSSNILIVREYPLESLPAHSETFVEEVGDYFTWAWPFFNAAVSGAWQSPETTKSEAMVADNGADDVDESARKRLTIWRS